MYFHYYLHEKKYVTLKSNDIYRRLTLHQIASIVTRHSSSHEAMSTNEEKVKEAGQRLIEKYDKGFKDKQISLSEFKEMMEELTTNDMMIENKPRMSKLKTFTNVLKGVEEEIKEDIKGNVAMDKVSRMVPRSITFEDVVFKSVEDKYTVSVEYDKKLELLSLEFMNQSSLKQVFKGDFNKESIGKNSGDIVMGVELIMRMIVETLGSSEKVERNVRVFLLGNMEEGMLFIRLQILYILLVMYMECVYFSCGNV